MKGFIITGGSTDFTFAKNYINQYNNPRIIAVDSGLKTVDSISLYPDIIVGDFDSVSPELLAKYQSRKGIHFEAHNPVKDDTDTELAIKIAIEEGWEEIILLGATGTRMDHTLSNIHIMRKALDKGIHCSVVDAFNCIYLLDQGKLFVRGECHGNFISFLPLTTKVEGITLTGFKYPLDHATIEIGTGLCISNELVGEYGEIDFKEGILICIESRD